ncbi:MAG: hypothetical protein WAM90_01040 [Rhodanobacter sp.]
MPEDLVQTHIKEGRLVRVLSDWCPPFSGYRRYYPSRRQTSLAFALFRDAMRYPKSTDNYVVCGATELLCEACFDHFQWAETDSCHPM